MDRDRSDFRGPPRGYGGAPPRRRSPPRRGGPPPRHDHRAGPLPFLEFAVAHLREDAGPEEARRAYDVYLADFWGSSARAEWEARRGEAALRSRFDPRELAPKAESRFVAARNAAAAWHAAHAAGEPGESPVAPEADAGGEIDTKEGDANDASARASPEGDDDGRPASAQAAPVRAPTRRTVPPVAWAPDRVLTDAKLAARLVVKLDAEKGVEDNPLIVVTLPDTGVTPPDTGATSDGEHLRSEPAPPPPPPLPTLRVTGARQGGDSRGSTRPP